MALSDQLKAIRDKATMATNQQANVGLAQNAMQTSQALGQLPTQGPGAKSAVQQTAAAVTQANQQVTNQANQQMAQTAAGLGQAQLQQQGAARQAALGKQQMLNDEQISELQRAGQLRQNSATLESAKKLQANEIATQKRMAGAQIGFDESLSFLTRKQREDLAKIGNTTKHYLFDQRLMFRQAEDKRKFTNMQQLADYSIASYQDDQQLQNRMREMEQAVKKEMAALQHAHNMIVSQMESEFKRAEKRKDYALMRELEKRKIALEEKMQRKAAKGAMVGNIIQGGFMIGGAVAGGMATGTPQGAMIGAQVGGGAGQVVHGGLQSSGTYESTGVY